MAGRGVLLAATVILIATPVTERAQGVHEQTTRELFRPPTAAWRATTHLRHQPARTSQSDSRGVRR